MGPGFGCWSVGFVLLQVFTWFCESSASSSQGFRMVRVRGGCLCFLWFLQPFFFTRVPDGSCQERLLMFLMVPAANKFLCVVHVDRLSGVVALAKLAPSSSQS